MASFFELKFPGRFVTRCVGGRSMEARDIGEFPFVFHSLVRSFRSFVSSVRPATDRHTHDHTTQDARLLIAKDEKFTFSIDMMAQHLTSR